MTRIVTYAHRPKRPPRKRAKAAAIEGPAVVTSREGKRVRRSDDTAACPVVRWSSEPTPAGLLPETEEEIQRRGDAVDALWRELVRRVREKP